MDGQAVGPIADIDGTRRTYRTRDRRGKTVVRLELEDGRIGGRGRLDTRLRVIVSAGCERAHGDVMAALGGLRRSRRSVSRKRPRPWRPSARAPAHYRARLRPGDSASEGVRDLLATLLASMTANEPGIRDDADMEYLHQLRVAIRRMRTLLGEIKGVLPRREAADLRGEMRWIAVLTGHRRGLDVQIENLTDYPGLLPEDMATLLGSVEDRIRTRRRQAHPELLAALLQDPAQRTPDR